MGKICKQKKTQIIKIISTKISNRVEHDYKYGDNVMRTKHTLYKYETPYKGPFMITQCFTNVMVNLQCGPTKNRYNIRQINPYKSDINVEDISSKSMSDDVNT